ncbi:MAG: ATP-grasp domain-containing protein [Longimicrobiales bacterium]
MALVTKRIGLSLGADICWPIAFTEIMKRLDLEIRVKRDRVRFHVERMTIDPFDVREPKRYDLVIDRLTHWYHVRREWIKKAVVMDDVYVFNNPWAVQSMEKLTTYAAMIRLGFPIPETWLIPPHSYEPVADLEYTLKAYARLFDLGAIGKKLGYPMFMKPYDGGGWRAVTKLDDESALREAYDHSGKLVMTLQAAVHPSDRFVRCIGLGPQTHVVLYDAKAALHDRYTMARDFVTAEERSLVDGMTMVINAFFGWDFNSCELLHKEGTWYPIDYANPCPDSQVTSLHYHFPWIIKANIRWATFAAATGRKVKQLDWQPFFDAVEEGMTLRERLDALVPLAMKRFDADRFEEFCAKHLAHLDEVTHDWFGTDDAKEAVRRKVAALFPPHEVDAFTDVFFQRIQQWRADEPVGARS